jgi:hypothetical protein
MILQVPSFWTVSLNPFPNMSSGRYVRGSGIRPAGAAVGTASNKQSNSLLCTPNP